MSIIEGELFFFFFRNVQGSFVEDQEDEKGEGREPGGNGDAELGRGKGRRKERVNKYK